MRIASKQKSGETGNAVLEFCLCCIVMMPFLMGVCGGGVALIRQIELTQTSRDAGHMYANGIDFSDPANQALVMRIADSLGFAKANPAGGLCLSTVTYITDTDCKAGGFSNGCANQGYYVITRQIQVGAPAPSSIGTAFQPDAQGNVSEKNYLNNSGARVKAFSSDIGGLWQTLNQDGQLAYVSEASVQSSDLVWTGFFTNWLTAVSFF